MITAIFDGRCAICQTTRALVKALDWRRRIAFQDLHESHHVSQRFPQLEGADLMGQIHVITESGRVYAGFDGTRRMLRELPLGIPFWAVLHLPGMNRLGPRIYGWIARRRYAINRLLGIDLQAQDDCVDGICKLP